jgi:P27 family predicted phage terminase small subunit
VGRGVARGGRSGRPPKPTERKRRSGNPGKRPLPAPTAIVPGAYGVPEPPALQSEGLGLWGQVWAEAGDWLAPSDRPTVELLCRLADERASWLALAAEQGLTSTSRHGTTRIHPAVMEARALATQMITLLSLLGLTPSDRARLGLVEVRKMTGLADLAARRADAIGK